MSDITIKQAENAANDWHTVAITVWEVNWTVDKDGKRSREAIQFDTLDEATNFVKSELGV